MRQLTLALGLLAGPALAECPPIPDRSAELEALFAAAREAPNEMVARVVAQDMWAIWTEAPDEAAQALLDRGMTAMRISDFLSAIDAFNRLVEYCPHFAEGYNQRAFVNFLNGQFAEARVDLERVVEINPKHVGALSGLALILTALGDEQAGQEWLRQALELNPWIPERRMLKDQPGKDL